MLSGLHTLTDGPVNQIFLFTQQRILSKISVVRASYADKLPISEIWLQEKSAFCEETEAVVVLYFSVILTTIKCRIRMSFWVWS